ncbi:MAG: hypothetical protein JF597_26075 [Streptomyces sp.]|uniref:hypothetical protein n=1 Tax=Streptomyces sp. TaxID=1931 RepID=UPI0025E9957A|nr:hypothetical protein [Streptomyces sp.]MBW8796940.1 hypothetical protein [Streptomyces sp.]
MTLRRLVRPALLVPAAMCVLASCGIPTTGVVQAGGPAVGVVPETRLYFVRDGALFAVRRPTDAPGDVESAVLDLLRGPTDAELRKGVTTRLPLPTGLPTAVPAVPADGGATVVPEAPSRAGLVEVTAGDHRISVRLSSAAGDAGDPGLAAAQIACTAAAAQRVADPGAEPAPVTVTLPGGRRFEGATTRCPGV